MIIVKKPLYLINIFAETFTSSVDNIRVYTEERGIKELIPYHLFNVMTGIFLLDRHMPMILFLLLITFYTNGEDVPKCDG